MGEAPHSSCCPLSVCLHLSFGHPHAQLTIPRLSPRLGMLPPRQTPVSTVVSGACRPVSAEMGWCVNKDHGWHYYNKIQINRGTVSLVFSSFMDPRAFRNKSLFFPHSQRAVTSEHSSMKTWTSSIHLTTVSFVSAWNKPDWFAVHSLCERTPYLVWWQMSNHSPRPPLFSPEPCLRPGLTHRCLCPDLLLVMVTLKFSRDWCLLSDDLPREQETVCF